MSKESINTYSLPIPADKIEATFYNSPAHVGPYAGSLDFAVPVGTPVIVPLDGVVKALEDEHVEYGPSKEYADKANWLQIEHSEGETSDLIHLERGSIKPKVGDRVKQGQEVARTGLSGWLTDPHLHWGVFRMISEEPGFKTLPIKLIKTAAEIVASKEIIVISTDTESVFLRQYALPSDDKSYFDLQAKNTDYWAEFGNKIYKNLEEVEAARLDPQLLRFGCWNNDTLIGDLCIASKDAKEAELGISLDKAMSGKGYATLALGALTAYALDNYERVFAEVEQYNERSIALLQRTGYVEPEPGKLVQRDWGKALTFEAVK